MTNWGLIARAESDRGLGVLTRLMYSHLSPDRTLLVTVDHQYVQETSAFPDATLVPFTGELDELVVKEWLDGLDVVVSCETFYDRRVIGWARELGVKTILYVMPEFLKAENPQPDAYWYPSSWRLDKCPTGVLLPVPCETRQFVDLPDPTGPVKFLHVAGKPALGDRNGTQIVVEAVKRARSPIHFTTYGQGLDRPQRLPHWHRVEPGPSNKWEMYESAHVLVLPRRFGGLSLPVIEALACGLAVVMTNVTPNTDWPIVPIEVNVGRKYEMPCGKVTTYDATLDDLGRLLAVLKNPAPTTNAMTAARAWATNNTWDLKRGDFLRALG